MKAPTQLFAVQPPPTDAERIDALEQRVAQLEKERKSDQLILAMQVEALKAVHAWMKTTGARIDLETIRFGGAS